MKGRHILAVTWLLIFILATGFVSTASAAYATGAWDNFDYSKPVDYWISAARCWGGDSVVLDLAVVQAQDGYAALPFAYSGSSKLRGVSDTDLLEPYLCRLDSEGIGVILSVQPMYADVTDLIGIILDRYGHHRCVRGINVDLEWKNTGTPQHANNQERDAWTSRISSYNPQLKLFLTYFMDYSYFPDDDGKMVVMYDGSMDTQENLMKAYGELAKHFSAVGIYTGYSSSRPPAASNEEILRAAPNTQYIIHTDDARSAAGSSGSSKISLPSALSLRNGFGKSGLSNKLSMPSSMLSGNDTSYGFPSMGSMASSILKSGDTEKTGMFKSANGDNSPAEPLSQVNLSSTGQRMLAGSNRSLADTFSKGLSGGSGFGKFTGFGKRLFS